MSEKQILITVGTTKFENLIKAIDTEKFYEMIIKYKFTKIIIQKGTGEYIPKIYEKYKDKINIQVSTLLNDFENIIKNSEIIISHGGAGIILECLKNKKERGKNYKYMTYAFTEQGIYMLMIEKRRTI